MSSLFFKRGILEKKIVFNPAIKILTIFLAIFAIGFGVYSILANYNNALSLSTSKKFIPFIIIFLGLNSLMKNLFSLNSVKIYKGKIVFCRLLFSCFEVSYIQITKLAFVKGKRKMIRLSYTKESEKVQNYIFSIAFPGMIEVLQILKSRSPKVEFDEILEQMITNTKF